MRAPKVSVIIPVWNTGESACRLIRQVLDAYGDLEVIAVDDGSTDESLELLRGLDDERMKVVHQENAGPSAARNAGIRECRGEYLLFLDSDDEIAPEYVRTLVEIMDGHPEVTVAATGIHYRKLARGTEADVYLAPRRKRREGESLVDYMLYLLLLDGRMYGVVNKIFRGEVVRRHGLEFEVGRKFAEDTNFVLQYLKVAPGEIWFVPKALYTYNYGTETSVVKESALDWKNWEQSWQDLEKWAGKGGARTWVLLRLVRLRWRVSHLRSQRARARYSR